MRQILLIIITVLVTVFSSCTGQKIPQMRPDSDFLLGYWQCGYSYYLEVTEKELTLRDSMKRVTLQTEYQVLQENNTWYLLPEDPFLTYDYLDQPYGEVTQLCYEDGELHLFYYHYYDPDEIIEELFESMEEGPFSDIVIRDDEFLDELQGKWKEDPDGFYTIYIDGNHMSIGYEDEETGFESFDEIDFHVISYRYLPEYISLIHSDLVETEFYAFTQFDYEDGTLRANEMVLDADWDTSVTFLKMEE